MAGDPGPVPRAGLRARRGLTTRPGTRGRRRDSRRAVRRDPGASHLAPYTHPAEVAAAVVQFFASFS